MLRLHDKDGDGKLNLDEFKAWCAKTPVVYAMTGLLLPRLAGVTNVVDAAPTKMAENVVTADWMHGKDISKNGHSIPKR